MWQNPLLLKGSVGKRCFSASRRTYKKSSWSLHNIGFVGGQCFLAGLLKKIPGQALRVEADVLLVLLTGAWCPVNPAAVGSAGRGAWGGTGAFTDSLCCAALAS